MKKTTQETIAKTLNLSRVTVSKALLGKGGISEDTKRLVFETAAKLGYIPNKVQDAEVQTLYNQKPKVFALLFPGNNISPGFWSNMMQNINIASQKYNAHIQLFFVTDKMDENLELPTDFEASNVDGIISMGTFRTEYYRLMASQGIPMVSEDISVELYYDPICDVVTMENHRLSYQLTKHLIDKGHKKIAFVGSRDICTTFHLRWQGYCNALLDYNIPCCYEDLFQYPTIQSQYDVNHLLSALEKSDDLPTAYVCANDSIAYSMYFLKSTHPNILGDIDLTGFDNDQKYAPIISSFATAEIFPEEIAKCLIEQMLWRCEHPNRPFRIVHVASKILL